MPGKGLISTTLELEKKMNIFEPPVFHEISRDLCVFTYPNSNVINFYHPEGNYTFSTKWLDFLEEQTITGLTSHHDTLFIASKKGGRHNCSPTNTQSIHIVDINNIHEPKLIKNIPNIFSFICKTVSPYYSVSLAVSNELLFCAGKQHLAIYHYPTNELKSHYTIAAPFNHPHLYATEDAIIGNFNTGKKPQKICHQFFTDHILKVKQSYSFTHTSDYLMQFPLKIANINYMLHLKLSTTVVNAEIYSPNEQNYQLACKFSLPAFYTFYAILENGSVLLSNPKRLIESYRCPAFEDFIKMTIHTFRQELLTQTPLPTCITEFILVPFILNNSELLTSQLLSITNNTQHFFQLNKNHILEKPEEVKEVFCKPKQV